MWNQHVPMSLGTTKPQKDLMQEKYEIYMLGQEHCLKVDVGSGRNAFKNPVWGKPSNDVVEAMDLALDIGVIIASLIERDSVYSSIDFLRESLLRMYSIVF